MSTDKENEKINGQEETAAQAEEEIKDETVGTVDEIIEEVREETSEEKKEEKKRFGRKERKAEEKEQEEKHAQELAERDDRYLRLAAEYDNFRRRSQKEKDNRYNDGKTDTLIRFLPVYDNLVRALNTATEDEAYRRGVEMIMTQFSDTMEKLGVEKIESLGKTFDPTVHNAVMHVDDEEKGENEVVEVFQEGFRIGDKVVRCAMVKVAN